MRKAIHLGSVEMLVMLALMRLGDNAYGVTISRELEDRTGRNVAVASVYTTLERLERKGLVASRLGEPSAERGGRAKKFFSVTSKGVRAVRDTHAELQSLWRDLPQLREDRYERI